MSEIELGDKVKDKYTDLEGTVLAITNYINGCVQALVVPKELKDGKPVEDTWVDLVQLKIIKKGNVKEEEEEPPKKEMLKKKKKNPPHGGVRSHPK